MGKSMKLAWVSAAALAAILGTGVASTLAQVTTPAPPAASAAVPPTTLGLAQAQIDRGRQVQGLQCSDCHGVTLRGGMGPALRDEVFQRAWSGQTVAALFDFMKSAMPPGAPGTLADDQYIDIIAFILSVNGFAPAEGAPELVFEDLGEIVIP